jgi:hypothetical protein
VSPITVDCVILIQKVSMTVDHMLVLGLNMYNTNIPTILYAYGNLDMETPCDVGHLLLAMHIPTRRPFSTSKTPQTDDKHHTRSHPEVLNSFFVPASHALVKVKHAATF